MKYEGLIIEAEADGISVLEHRFKTTRIKGLCINRTLTINSSIETNAEKLCILGEEMGHCYTSAGNILNLKHMPNKKQEKRARNWAYERLVPLSGIVLASQSGVKSRFELARFLQVTEDFIDNAIIHYREKYGPYAKFNNHIIYFEPLGVWNIFNPIGEIE